jgi:hypothetical protein
MTEEIIEVNDQWECFLCCKEDDFDVLPFGYLGNSHPLCAKCADNVLYNKRHPQRFRLTYHKFIGDIAIEIDA